MNSNLECGFRAVTVDEQRDVEGGTASAIDQAWLACLKSCADVKAQIQGELARFR